MPPTIMMHGSRMSMKQLLKSLICNKIFFFIKMIISKMKLLWLSYEILYSVSKISLGESLLRSAVFCWIYSIVLTLLSSSP